MLLDELLGQGHVLLLGLVARGPLFRVPGVPLGLALEVEHAGPIGVDVAHRGLLVQPVDLLQLLVGQRLVHLVVDVVDGGRKVLLESHDDGFDFLEQR